MAKKRNNNVFRNSMVVLGVILLAVLASQQLGFTIAGESIWLPEYLTGECVERGNNLATVQKTSHTDSPSWYHCNTNEANSWVPSVSGIQCEYSISQFSSASVHVCKGFTENQQDLDTSKCEDKLSFIGQLQAVPRTFSVNSGDSIYINTNKVFGNAKLGAKYPSYGLRVRQSDGFTRPTTDSCSLNSLSSDVHTVDRKDSEIVVPDVPFNAVSGLKIAFSNQVVSLSDVRSGETIYISRPRYYNLVKTADDGFRYVDTTREFRDDDIECIPRTTGCSDEAKIIPLEDQSCDKFGGAVTGFSPVAGDSTKLCKYSCKNGQLDVTNDCIKVQQNCPPEEPVWNTETGECIAVEELDDGDEKQRDLIPVFIIIGTVLVLMFMLIIARQRGRI